MLRCIRTILLFFGFFSCSQMIAQSPPSYLFNHLDHSSGLMNDAVYAIGQDRIGFIWISSQNTLQRYDGVRFVNYPQFRAIDTVKTLPKTSENYTDDSGYIWTIGGRFFYRYDSLASQKPFRFIITWPDKGYEYVNTICIDSLHDQAWASSGRYGLLLLDTKRKRIYHHLANSIHHPLLQKLRVRGLRSLMMDSRHNLWICYWDGDFYRFSRETNTMNRYDLSTFKKSNAARKQASLLVNTVYEDNHHNVWIGTENTGLLLYNSLRDNFTCFSSNENNDRGIQYNYDIYCIFQDKEENLWVGTDKGITVFNPYRRYFTAIKNEPGYSRSLPKHEIMACIETKQHDLLVGTWGGGLSIFDSSLQFKRNIVFTGPPELNLLWSFIERDDTTIIIGCQHGYLHLYNQYTGSIQTIRPVEMENSTVRCMAKDREGNILFGLHNGSVVTWDRASSRFYGDKADKVPSYPFTPVTNIFVDHAQNCWVSTEHGFRKFDKSTRSFTYTEFPVMQNGKPVAGITCQGIEEWNDSVLLVGTTRGLFLFNKNEKTFTPFPEHSAINSVFAIRKDESGNIWFTTDYGLYEMRADDHSIVASNMNVGLINSSFQFASFYATKHGRWFAATPTELISFYPAMVNSQMSQQSNVAITGIKVFDKTVSTDSVISSKEIRLSYRQNFLDIEFALLNFYDIKQADYSYRLTDVDKNWVSAGAKRFANYTDLQPGHYTFMVKAGDENSHVPITAFDIIISPPFWKTAWFRLLCILISVAIAVAIVQWRIKIVRKEAFNKAYFNQQMTEMEMKALRAQMNPHFIFNCLNSIDALIQNDEKYRATTYLNKFAKLIRNILDSSKHHSILFTKDLETLRLYLELEQLRDENKFAYRVHVDNDLLQSDCRVPSLAIQPFVENAIHHGLRNRITNDGHLDIDIQYEKEHIVYTITDNGIGRLAASQLSNGNDHEPYGLQMIRERIRRFNEEENASVDVEDLFTSNDEPGGTRVKVRVKVK